jgi:hypothetical protein
MRACIIAVKDETVTKKIRCRTDVCTQKPGNRNFLLPGSDLPASSAYFTSTNTPFFT